MIITKCDKCGVNTADLSYDSSKNQIYNLALVSRDSALNNLNVIVDLCMSCRLKVIKYMRCREEVVEFPQPLNTGVDNG